MSMTNHVYKLILWHIDLERVTSYYTDVTKVAHERYHDGLLRNPLPRTILARECCAPIVE